VKPLETFDFGYQPRSTRSSSRSWRAAISSNTATTSLCWVRPGGQDHLSVGLGLKAIQAGYRVFFSTAANLIAALTKRTARDGWRRSSSSTPPALVDHRRDRLSADRAPGANLFFQLISRRYERGPMILTSNQSFGPGARCSRSGDRHRDPGSLTASRGDLEHPRQLLPAQGKAESGWCAPRKQPVLNSGGENSIDTTGEIWTVLDSKAVLRKQLRRSQVAAFFANLPICLVGMEACGGAHHWARKLQALGHSVKLMAPQFIKPYVKSNKNDAADAEAICEAVSRPTMRFVRSRTSSSSRLGAAPRPQGFVKARTAQAIRSAGCSANSVWSCRKA